MTLFTIYNPETGQIHRSGFCQEQCIAMQAEEGEALLEGVRGDPATQHVDIEADPPVVVDNE